MRVREVTSLGVLIVALLAVEAMSMRAGGSTSVVLMALLGLLAVLVIAVRADLSRVAVVSGCACAFVLSWNGVYAGPARAGDLLIFVTLVLVFVARPDQLFAPLPWWVKWLAGVIVVGVLLQIFFPPDLGQLSQRLALNTVGQPASYIPINLPLANITVAFKLLTNIALIPLALVGVVRIDARAVRWLGIAYALGCAVSGWLATVDHFGGNFASILTGIPNSGTRQAGLTLHPNYLAGGLTVAIPFAFWILFLDDRRLRLAGVVALPGILLGVFSSGSRGGTVGAVLALGLCIVLHPRTRPYLINFAVGLGTLLGVFATVLPGLGAEILKVTRLRNEAVTDGSDQIRDLAAKQANSDFAREQLHGLGLQVIDQASQSYLGVLASGGVLLAAGAVVYTVGGLITAGRVARTSPLAGMVAAALASIAALYLVEPGITDRFYYLPAALLIAMVDLQRRGVAWREGTALSRGAAARARELAAARPVVTARHALAD